MVRKQVLYNPNPNIQSIYVFTFFTTFIPRVFFFAFFTDDVFVDISARAESGSRLCTSGSMSSAFRFTVITFSGVESVEEPGIETLEKTALTSFSSSSSSFLRSRSSADSISSSPIRSSKSTVFPTRSFLAFRARMSCRASKMSISRLESVVRFSSAFIGLFSSSSSFASLSSSWTACSSLHGSKFREAPCSAA